MASPSVCDLTLIMRTRLFFGLYNRHTVPPRWQGFAKAYCLILFLALSTLIITWFMHYKWTSVWFLYILPSFCQYALAVFVSLWTEDEFIFSFYSRNNVTDVTLDSAMVFNRFKKQIKRWLIATIVLFFIIYGLEVMIWYKHGITVLVEEFIIIVINLLLLCSYTTKLLVMGLFNSRIIILRRRLERYGFRTTGRVPPQPYCQIYDEILRGLEATDNPLKLFIFFDIIGTAVLLMGDMHYFINEVQGQIAAPAFKFIWFILVIAAIMLNRACFAYGDVALLESAATHCDAMAVFTVVQLIKTPSEEERSRMYCFLDELERRGARYQVLRALPRNARFLLQILGFCTAQAIVLMNMVQFVSYH